MAVLLVPASARQSYHFEWMGYVALGTVLQGSLQLSQWGILVGIVVSASLNWT